MIDILLFVGIFIGGLVAGGVILAGIRIYFIHRYEKQVYRRDNA